MTKHITFNAVISISALIILVATMLLVQKHVKLKPSSIIAIYTTLSILSFVFKKDELSTVLLMPIIFLCSYFFWFSISNEIKDTFFPWQQVPGNYVTDTRFIYFIPIAILLSVFTTYLYFTKAARNKKGEVYILTIYLISTVAIICYKHL